MKKNVLFSALLALALMLCACSVAPDGGEGLVNPVTEYATMDKLNQAAGTQLVAPEIVDLTDEVFSTITCETYTIAEYRFCVGDTHYTLRSAPTTEDISGYYVGGNVAFPNAPKEGIEYADADDGVKLARWLTES